MSKKHVLIGNGININFGGRDYTNGQIIERLSMKLKHNDGYYAKCYWVLEFTTEDIILTRLRFYGRNQKQINWGRISKTADGRVSSFCCFLPIALILTIVIFISLAFCILFIA